MIELSARFTLRTETMNSDEANPSEFRPLWNRWYTLVGLYSWYVYGLFRTMVSGCEHVYYSVVNIIYCFLTQPDDFIYSTYDGKKQKKQFSIIAVINYITRP